MKLLTKSQRSVVEKTVLDFEKKMTEKKIFVNYKIVSITVIEAFG